MQLSIIKNLGRHDIEVTNRIGTVRDLKPGDEWETYIVQVKHGDFSAHYTVEPKHKVKR